MLYFYTDVNKRYMNSRQCPNLALRWHINGAFPCGWIGFLLLAGSATWQSCLSSCLPLFPSDPSEKQPLNRVFLNGCMYGATSLSSLTCLTTISFTSLTRIINHFFDLSKWQFIVPLLSLQNQNQDILFLLKWILHLDNKFIGLQLLSQ